MTIREEIREELRKILPAYANSVDAISDMGLTHSEERKKWGELLEETIKVIQGMESSKGVVIKTEGELPGDTLDKKIFNERWGKFTKYIPLVEEE